MVSSGWRNVVLSFLKAKFRWILLLPMILFPILNSSMAGRYWQLNSGLLIPVQQNRISSSSELLTPALSGDLDGDNQPECLLAEAEALHITNCDGQILWQSPDEWRVSEAQIADLNHDGINEAVLLVWRAFQPWPVDEFLPFGGRIESHQNHEGQSCQLILIGWQRDDYREIWAGSALANPISNVMAADLDGDGLVELAALENDYDAKQKGGQLTIWRWIGFGFSLLDRSESRWERLTIMGDGVHYWLFTR